MKTPNREELATAGFGRAASADSGFLPLRPLPETAIMVTPMSEPKAEMKPIEYYINGFVRHHEKLSGMAGDRHRNKLSACIQNACLSHGEGGKKS